MAALWSAAELSAWELEDAAQAGVFYTASGAAGLSSTLSWGTDKAAATPWSPKECALVADFQAAMARKRLDAIPEAGEELSVEPAKPDFAFAPDDDSFGKVRAATAQPAPHARGAFSARGGPLGSSGFYHIGAQLFLSRQRAPATRGPRSARLRGDRASAAAGARLIQRCAVGRARSGAHLRGF